MKLALKAIIAVLVGAGFAFGNVQPNIAYPFLVAIGLALAFV
jgi:hypothetical protein